MEPVRVTFENVLRAWPIVLTQHQVNRLSSEVGRDVLPELRQLSGQRFEAKTLGKLLRDLKRALSAEVKQ